MIWRLPLRVARARRGPAKLMMRQTELRGTPVNSAILRIDRPLMRPRALISACLGVFHSPNGALRGGLEDAMFGWWKLFGEVSRHL